MESKSSRDCQRYKLLFLNPETGQVNIKGCGAYFCPDCGPIKIKKLRHAVYNELKIWKHKCFWTFTLNSKITNDLELHYKILSESYERLITYLRRDKLISNNQFKYIRINELHQSGYAHIHVMVDTFFPAKYIIGLWQGIVNKICLNYGILYNPNVLCGCYVRYKSDVGHATNYLVKYVTKSVENLTGDRIFHFFYTKSHSIVFFSKKEKLSSPGRFYVYYIYSDCKSRLIGSKFISDAPQLNKSIVLEICTNFNNLFDIDKNKLLDEPKTD